MYEVIFIEVFSSSNDFIKDLFLANFQRLLNNQKETFFLKSVFARVRKSGLQGCSVREKGSVLQNISGAWGKNASKKNCRVKRGKELLLKTKRVLIKICDISHLLACKLPQKFISWVSRKTEMSNCVVFCSTNHRGDSHGSTCTTSNISSIKTYMIFL